MTEDAAIVELCDRIERKLDRILEILQAAPSPPLVNSVSEKGGFTDIARLGFRDMEAHDKLGQHQEQLEWLQDEISAIKEHLKIAKQSGLEELK